MNNVRRVLISNKISTFGCLGIRIQKSRDYWGPGRVWRRLASSNPNPNPTWNRMILTVTNTGKTGKFKVTSRKSSLTSSMNSPRKSYHRTTEVTKKPSICFDQECLEGIAPSYAAVAPPSFPCRPGPLIPTEGAY